MAFFRSAAFGLGRFVTPVMVSLSASARSVTSEGWGPGVATTEPTTAVASGGSGGYTYSWSCTNGWVANQPTSATTTFTSPAIPHWTSVDGVATLTVTDAQTGTAVQALVELTHSRNVVPLSGQIWRDNAGGGGWATTWGVDGNPSGTGTGFWSFYVTGGSGQHTRTWMFIEGDQPLFWNSAPSGEIAIEMMVPIFETRAAVFDVIAVDDVTGDSIGPMRYQFTFHNPS